MRYFVSLVMIVLVPRALFAQSTGAPASTVRAGARQVLPPTDEIALARSAATATISSSSRVMILTDSGYIVGEKGSSTMTCVVNRSWKDSVEPHCYDQEGAATVMQIELRRNFLRHRGRSETEISADIGAGMLSGKYRLPSRPALSYMMSPRQILYGDDGKLAGKWRPHVMIYYPYLTNQALGFREQPEMAVGMVSESGDPQSSIMLIMPKFAEPEPRRAP